MGHAVAAAAAFVAACVSGVVAAFVAARPLPGLWVALGVSVVVGAVLQGAVTASERRRRSGVLAAGPGAVAVGGSAGEIRTRAQGVNYCETVSERPDITASGPGSVSVGGDINGPVVTEVADVGNRRGSEQA